MKKTLLFLAMILTCCAATLTMTTTVSASIPKNMDLATRVDRGALLAMLETQEKIQVLRVNASGMVLAPDEEMHIYRATANVGPDGTIEISDFKKIAICQIAQTCIGDVKMEWSEVFLLMYRIQKIAPEKK